MSSSEHDRLAELKRIQQKEYKRVVDEIAKKACESTGIHQPIFTDRTTMERKDDKRKDNII